MYQVSNLSHTPSIANQFVAEMRSTDVQQDRQRFRRNLERIGEVIAYEISRTMRYQQQEVVTPLGVAAIPLPAQRVVLGTILRAGLPFHTGLLNYFDRADNCFISAFRRHHKDGSFDIQLDYISTADLQDCVLILADPMLATGASINLALQELARFGEPAAVHIATVIASTTGIEAVHRLYPKAHIWAGAVDEELTAKSYIVPGLGDAGDLAYGEKQG